jgi:hypothetical protein
MAVGLEDERRFGSTVQMGFERTTRAWEVKREDLSEQRALGK